MQIASAVYAFTQLAPSATACAEWRDVVRDSTLITLCGLKMSCASSPSGGGAQRRPLEERSSGHGDVVHGVPRFDPESIKATDHKTRKRRQKCQSWGA